MVNDVNLYMQQYDQASKGQSYERNTDLKRDKGLLVVHFHLKKPMQIIFVNTQVTKITGYSKEEMLGLSLSSIMP